MPPVVVPDTPDAIHAELDRLTEIQAHREWVIEGLRAHVCNIEHDLERARHRVEELEKHTKNVELQLAGTTAHAENLAERLAERERRLGEVEEEARALEQRVRGRRSVRLATHGIFPEVENRSIDAIFRVGNRIWSARPDLQRHYPQDHAADFWYWLLWDREADADVARVRLPIPDAHLRERVRGGGSEIEYVRSGLVDGWRTDGCLRQGGFDPAAGGALLDFGVGCARVAQYFALYAGRTRIHGCDVDAEAIRWCGEHLDFATFDAIGPAPPTPYEDGQFDAVYAYSVFSHLPEDLHLDWLAELRRITRPGGVLVLTVHGQHVVDEVLAGRALPRLREPLAAREPELRRRGFAFLPYGALDLRQAGNDRFFESWDLERYGDTFILEPYVRERWAERFEVVALVPAPDAWQDYVILRTR
jgi:SAM-dependent methyltransferase